MCPKKERLSFTDVTSAGAESASGVARARIGLHAVLAAISAWAFLVAVYAFIFALSPTLTLSRAIRGGLANGIPDGLLALAVFRIARRLDAPRARFRSLIAGHLLRGLVFVGCASTAKTVFLWADVTLFGSKEPFRLFAGVVAWQVFVSTLIYVASAAACHVWLIDRRLREEEARAARAEALRARAELSVLRAQLNPHFLFNVLHSVLGMVRGDPALAEAALEGLGDLLRYALRVHRDGMDRTALRHEWEFMEAYLNLEKIRLGERLQIARRAEEGVLDHAVPTFSLQPLVENAVRHGIAPRAAGGRLSIEARSEGSELHLEVRNDGGDGSPSRVEGEGGMGQRILRERLDVLYRGRASMKAGPAENGGYRVVIRLPLESFPGEAGS